MAASKHLLPGEVRRFWSKVDRRGPGECWLWIGNQQSQHYGQFWLRGENVLAHRVAYEISRGPLSRSWIVTHPVCHTKLCVNPAHLGTASGEDRAAHGERHSNARLTNADILEIRNLYANTNMFVKAIGAQFGVTHQAVRAIVKGRTWKHVTGGVPLARRKSTRKRTPPHEVQAKRAAKRARVVSLRAQHKSQAEVARILGVSKATVAYWERRPDPCTTSD